MSKLVKALRVFRNLEDPIIMHYSADLITKCLETISDDGFEYFSPRNIGLYFLGNMARMNPDSEYGVIMDITQKMMACTLYSGKGLQDYVAQVALSHKQCAEAEEKEFSSTRYKLLRSIGLIPERLRRKIGLGRRYLDDDLSGMREREVVNLKRFISDVYGQLAQTTGRMIDEFGALDVPAIIERVELNHLLSGEKNGTGHDILLTDTQMQQYIPKDINNYTKSYVLCIQEGQCLLYRRVATLLV